MDDCIDITAEDRDIAKHFEENGIAGLYEELKKKVNEWRLVPVNVGVVGESGCGKSSFINAIRNLCDDDEGAAEVGVTETTSVPTPHSYPGNENLKIWDLPGVGTRNFPKERYLDAIQFDRYDFFIIMTAGRFRENDLWFGKEIKDRKKTFYYVRTKVDQDVANVNKNKKNKRPEKDILSEIREDCRKNLQSHFSQIPVFLISSHETMKYDFPALTDQMVADAPDFKKQAMVLSLHLVTGNLIAEKKKYLQSRIWKLATLSAGVAAIPVPGLSISADTTILLAEVNFYKKQFGLDSETLSSLESEHGIEPDHIRKALSELSSTDKTAIIICDLLKAFAVSESTEELVRFIPFIGSAIAASISFATTYKMLSKCLDDMADDAKRLLELIKEKTASSA